MEAGLGREPAALVARRPAVGELTRPLWEQHGQARNVRRGRAHGAQRVAPLQATGGWTPALAAQWMQLAGANAAAAQLGLGLAGDVAAVPVQAAALPHREAKPVRVAGARGSLGWMATRPRVAPVEALQGHASRAWAFEVGPLSHPRV